jgi:hypothetical protein
MKIDRRQFFVVSSGALAVTPFVRVFGQSPPPAQTLAGVLGVAYDELTAR